jgi:ParB family chromosome partitioning protein
MPNPTFDTQVSFYEVAKLQPNPFQPRDKVTDDVDFDQLVQSVRVNGILEPLVIVQTPAGTHIIAGERRWRAAKKLGLKSVPVHLVRTTPRGMLEMAIVENIQRLDLSPIERAQALRRLMKDFHYSYEKLGERLGKSRQYVSMTITLLDLPDPVKDALNKGIISEGHARAILGAGDRHDMMRVFRQAVAEGASVHRTAALARFSRRKKEAEHQQRRPALEPDADLDELTKKFERDWQRHLVSKAVVNLWDTSRTTRVTVILKGDPQSRKKDLEKIMQLVAKG